MKPLEQILADARGDAAVLRRHGDTRVADAIDQLAHQVAHAAEDYLRWLTEDEAMTRSGWSRPRLRRAFPAWERDHLAAREGRVRRYRMLVIPQRGNPEAARAAGRRAAQEAA
jgi:hypothetical protein